MIMGNNPRNISDESLAILLNEDAIAVSQDPLGQMGIRISMDTDLQLWARNMANGDIAVALYNKNGNGLPPPPPIPTPPCHAWEETANGFYEPDPSNNVGTFSALSVADAKAACCSNPKCAGFSYVNKSDAITGRNGTGATVVGKGSGGDDGDGGGGGVGSGFYKGQPLSYLFNATGDYGFAKPSQVPSKPTPPHPADIDITLDFADLMLHGKVRVYDIWSKSSLGVFEGSYTAKGVPYHGTAFLRLTPLP